MEKSTILKLFLNLGLQIDQRALNILSENPDILELVLKTEKESLPTVITGEFLESLLNKTEEQKISVEQLSKVANYRYEFIRDLFITQQKLNNLLSINKITDKTKQFSVIGIVSEINDILTLEDVTGQAVFEIDKEQSKYIVEDEVIGLVCERKFGVNEVKQVIYPDIPIKKEISKTQSSEKCFFISDIHLDSPNFNRNYYKNFLSWIKEQKNIHIFAFGDISRKKEDIIKFISDMPQSTRFYSKADALKPITLNIQNIQILLSPGEHLHHYMNLWNTTLETTIINLLKKRNLNPILTPSSYNNAFLLETIPDIIVFSGVNKATTINYKGITIVTNGSFLTEPIYWLINLQTRETFKIDFS
ncbi:MAG: hypothetical protein QW818_02860 [Candidatus Aenigmatarchaeota archaeon]|nr:hypothetical protein [Candidatus Aenigmarchaeota archaeon]